MIRFIVLIIAVATCSVWALENGLCRTPPMGWNPWSEFTTNVTEAIFREVADSMVSKGLLAAGYIYMNQDGGGRYNNNAALGTWLHSKGFKFGMYGNNVNFTYSEETWVQRCVSAGADYVKWDAYNTSSGNATYTTVRDLLAASGRDIVFSAHWGDHSVNASTGDVANLWRTTPDVYIPWEDPRSAWEKIVSYIDMNNNHAAYAKPGAWNDPDFLLVGLTDGWTADVQGFTPDENKTHFSLWCISAAPLLIGSDIRDLKPSSLEVLLNTEVIAIDQDSLGYQGRRIRRNNDQTEIWSKNLQNGDKCVLLVNFSTAPKTVSVRWSEISMAGSVAVYDLWAHENLGVKTDSLRVSDIPAHGCAMFRLTGESVNIWVPHELRVIPQTQSRCFVSTAGRFCDVSMLTAADLFDPRGRALGGTFPDQRSQLTPSIIIQRAIDK